MRKKIIWIVIVILLIAAYPIIKNPYRVSDTFARDIDSINRVWIYSQSITYTYKDKEVIQEFVDLIDQNKILFTFKRSIQDPSPENHASFGFFTTLHTDFDLMSDKYIRINRQGLPTMFFKYENTELTNKEFSEIIAQFVEDHRDSFIPSN